MSIPSKYALIVFLLVVFLGAIVLGPLLYFGMAAVFPIPFHRAMDRALLICALAAIGLSWRRFPLGKLWPLNREAWQLLLGVLLALVSAQAMIGFMLAAGEFTYTPPDHSMVSRILLIMGAAILVPPLEETLFRGFIQGELIDRLGWRAGWIATAVIYTLAHFIKVPVELDQQPVHPWSGVSAIGQAFGHPGDVFSGKGLNLFLFGLILGGAFLRTGSLWLNAGIHGGMILVLFLVNDYTRPSPQPNVPYLDGDILSSPITSVVLIMLGLWLWRYYRNPSILPEDGPIAP